MEYKPLRLVAIFFGLFLQARMGTAALPHPPPWIRYCRHCTFTKSWKSKYEKGHLNLKDGDLPFAAVVLTSQAFSLTKLKIVTGVHQLEEAMMTIYHQTRGDCLRLLINYSWARGNVY